LYHQGRGEMLDHMLITRNLLAHYRRSEIHNEILHDESAAFAIERKYPESDHAPVVATFDF
jgi:exonuclease III